MTKSRATHYMESPVDTVSPRSPVPCREFDVDLRNRADVITRSCPSLLTGCYYDVLTIAAFHWYALACISACAHAMIDLPPRLVSNVHLTMHLLHFLRRILSGTVNLRA